MKITVLIIILDLVSLNLLGQTFDKHYFNGTSWYSENRDSLYFKNDTIKLIETFTVDRKLVKRKHSEESRQIVNNLELVYLKFESGNTLLFTEQNSLGFKAYLIGSWTWNYNKKRELLKIYHNNELINSFKPISQNEIVIEPNSDRPQPLTRRELTLVRVL